mgnify:CR=1 FL=1
MKILIFGMGVVADTYLHTYGNITTSVIGFLESGESGGMETDIMTNLYTH